MPVAAGEGDPATALLGLGAAGAVGAGSLTACVVVGFSGVDGAALATGATGAVAVAPSVVAEGFAPTAAGEGDPATATSGLGAADMADVDDGSLATCGVAGFAGAGDAILASAS